MTSLLRRTWITLVALVFAGGFLLGQGAALAELSGPEWQKVLDQAEGAAKREDTRAIAGWFLEVAKDDSERAAKTLVTIFGKLTKNADENADSLYAALEKLRAPKALGQMRKDLETSKDWRARVVLVDVLGARGKSEQEALCRAVRDDKAEEVIRAATRQLARLRTEAAILAMCDAMTKLEAKGKTAATWQDLRNALTRALGVDLQGGADYKNYFEANRARFAEGRGIPADPASAAGKREGGGRSGETVVFGTELYCKSVVLILDRSGSMVIADPYPDGMPLGSKSRELVESNGTKDPDRVRMKRAKDELMKLLDGLAKAKGKVNIIHYGSEVACWKDSGLHELGGEGLRSAKAFIEGIEADGITCTDVALERAFELAPAADCFYLISDGKATRAAADWKSTEDIPAREILATVSKLNKLRKVQINTFGFISPRGSGAEGADVGLMSGLAEQTGGTYTEIR